MRSQPRKSGMQAWGGVIVALVALALTGWVLASIRDIHDRISAWSGTAAGIVLALLLAALFAVFVMGVRFFWAATRTRHSGRANVEVAADPTQAAKQSLAAARQQLGSLPDEIAKQALGEQLDDIASDFAETRYTIVVFGTGSAGKTSVINALLGRGHGVTDPIIGTTQIGEEFAYTIDGFADGALRLVDTPGLSEIGEGGRMRESEARRLATAADLLVFVVDQDLRDIELKPLTALAKLGKRALLVLNKRDLYTPDDLDSVSKNVRDRVKGFIAPDDLVICAAAPATVTIRDAAGDPEHDRLTPDPDVHHLADRIAETLRRDGKRLLACNVLLRAGRVTEEARHVIHQARAEKATSIVSRFQWTTAAILFVNPVPGLGALAAAATNYQMIVEIARVFGVELTLDAAKQIAKQLGQVMLQMGVVGVATNILGKALKSTVVGYVAGGAVEAVSGAYLTKVSGDTVIDYFAADQDWGDGGVQGAVDRRFGLEGQREFVTRFVKEAAGRILRKEEQDA